MTSESKPSSNTRHAVIAGGGIAGLTTAICLARENWQVTLLESADEFESIGAGIQISPNGSRILERIGVLHELSDDWFEPEALELRHGSSDRQLLYLPMRDTALQRWGGRYFQVFRPDLIAALLRVIERHDSITCQRKTRVTGFSQNDVSVQVHTSTDQSLSADLLVAADGVHSTIRGQMGDVSGTDDKTNAEARFTGNVAWRAVVPVDSLGDATPPPTACVWTGEYKHAVTTRIRAGKWVNFVGIVEQENWQQEGWRHAGSKEQALADFGEWNESITAIINTADTLYRWALLDRPPLSAWSDRRVVLTGDAAHAMLPSMAQGAVQAIEDAWVLAQCHGESNDVTLANTSFFEKRIERTRRVQQESAANLHLFHKSGLVKQAVSYAPIWLAGKVIPWAIYRRSDWLYGQGPI